MDPSPPPPTRPLLPLALAFVGVSLLAAAYLAVAAGVFSGGHSLSTPLGYGLVVAGMGCHTAALALSLRAWREHGRVPGVALFYAALAVAGVAWWGLERRADARWYRETPGALSADLTADGIDVRDARGVWHVAFAGCPAAHGAPGYRAHDGVVEVTDAAGRAVMRLHTAERRAACLPLP